MIKKWHEITVSDYKLMELTGKVSQYKKWYNIFPTVMFLRQIKREATTLLSFIDNNRNTELEDEMKTQEMKYLAKLQIEVNRLQGVEQLIFSQLNNQAKLLGLKSAIKSRKLRKIVDNPRILQYAFNEAKDLTGIKIESEKDLVKFKRIVEHRTDKLSEYIRKKNTNKKEGKKEFLGSLINGIMMYLTLSPVGVDSMKVVDFMDFYKKAIDKYNAEKELIEKNKTK